uniref:Uncharacterized protein n=1 Tax=Phaeomonas parva TaxID=124430 RepID=A0A7S1ULQ3_9STRA
MADWRAVMDAEAMEAGRANRYRELVLAICKVDGFEKPTPEAMSTAKATDESCFKKATSWANYLERTGKKLKKLKDHYESKYGKPFEDTAALAARKAERAAAAKKKMAAQGPLLSEDQRRSYQMLLNYMLGDEGKKMIRESIKEMAAKKPEYKDRIVHWYNNGKNLKARLPTMERLSKDDRKVIEQLFKLKRFLEQKRERDPGKEEKRSSKRPAEFAPDVHAAYLPWLNGLWPAAYASVDGRGSADEEALGTSATGGNANWIIGYVRETLDGRTGLGYALADEAGMRHAAPFRRSPLPAAKVGDLGPNPHPNPNPNPKP